MQYFVLWGEPSSGFICPEPWFGGPNSLNTLEGVVELSAGQSFDWQFALKVI